MQLSNLSMHARHTEPARQLLFLSVFAGLSRVQALAAVALALAAPILDPALVTVVDHHLSRLIIAIFAARTGHYGNQLFLMS